MKIYTMNKVHIRKVANNNPYEIWFGHAPSMKYFRIFRSKCFLLMKIGFNKALKPIQNKVQT